MTRPATPAIDIEVFLLTLFASVEQEPEQ